MHHTTIANLKRQQKAFAVNTRAVDEIEKIIAALSG
jgi:hypothetical protein